MGPELSRAKIHDIEAQAHVEEGVRRHCRAHVACRLVILAQIHACVEAGYLVAVAIKHQSWNRLIE